MARLNPPVGPRDHAAGPSAAAVTLVEYGDYECPHCGAAYGVVKQLQETLGEDLRVVFRNFPLRQVHPHAQHAAEAAEAAAAQGRFWEMHDWLFEHQDTLDDDDLVAAAEALGLDLDRFNQDIRSGACQARVQEDFQSGLRSGVNATPTFFINGARHDHPPGYEDLLAAMAGQIRQR